MLIDYVSNRMHIQPSIRLSLAIIWIVNFVSNVVSKPDSSEIEHKFKFGKILREENKNLSQDKLICSQPKAAWICTK